MKRHMAQSWVVAGGKETWARIAGAILFVAPGAFGNPPGRTVVQFWYEEFPDEPQPPRRCFQSFGTGREIPSGAVYCKSVMAPDGRAWHLYELFGEEKGS